MRLYVLPFDLLRREAPYSFLTRTRDCACGDTAACSSQASWGWCILEGCPLRCADLFPARAPRHRSGDRRDRKPCAETNWPTWASSRRSRRQEDASRRIAFRETRTDEPQRRGDCFGCGPTVQGSANESFFGAGPARARSPFGGWQGAGGRCSWAAWRWTSRRQQQRWRSISPQPRSTLGSTARCDKSRYCVS